MNAIVGDPNELMDTRKYFKRIGGKRTKKERLAIERVVTALQQSHNDALFYQDDMPVFSRRQLDAMMAPFRLSGVRLETFSKMCIKLSGTIQSTMRMTTAEFLQTHEAAWKDHGWLEANVEPLRRAMSLPAYQRVIADQARNTVRTELEYPRAFLEFLRMVHQANIGFSLVPELQEGSGEGEATAGSILPGKFAYSEQKPARKPMQQTLFNLGR